MDKKLIMVLGVFLIVTLCMTAIYSDDSNHEDIPFKSIGDPFTQSHVLGSGMENEDLVVTIETTEQVTVNPTTVHHSVSLDDGVSTVTIYNYTGQIFHIATGNTSGIHLFGTLDKKEYNKINKTVTIINETSKKPKMTIKLLSCEPDLTTFTEIFEVTNFEIYRTDADLDYKARTVVHKGANDVFKTEWFIEVNQSYVVNVTDYKTIQVKKEVYNNKTGKNETVFMNETVISGYHEETQYRNVWSDYNKYGAKLPKNTIQKIKVVYHKKAELGDVHIQTVPVFCGVECDELTWWNTSWDYKIDSVVADDSFPYQMSLNVHSTAGTNNATDVFLDGHNSTNFNDIRFVLGDSTDLPYWIEDNTADPAKVWVNVTANGSVNLYYGNAAASSASSGADTFIQWHGAATSNFHDANVVSVPFIYEASAKRTSTHANNQISNGLSEAQDTYTQDSVIIYHINSGTQTMGRTYNNGATTSSGVHELPWTVDQYYRLKIVAASSSDVNFYFDNSFFHQLTTTVPDGAIGLAYHTIDGTGGQAWSFAREYAATEPTWGIWGEEESESTLTIIAYTPTTPITLKLGTPQTFDVTTNMTSSCKWYINGSLQQTNTTGATEHAYTNTSLEVGYWNFTAYTYTSTENASQTWWVTVDMEYQPPEPVNLVNTTGNFWVNHTWDPGAGNVTDAWNVSVNGVWYNRTYAWYNETYSAHAWQNITVYAWNESGFGTMSD